MKQKPIPCGFDHAGKCGAVACQQPDKECTARDENGNPIYANQGKEAISDVQTNEGEYTQEADA